MSKYTQFNIEELNSYDIQAEVLTKHPLRTGTTRKSTLAAAEAETTGRTALVMLHLRMAWKNVTWIVVVGL
jgi:hypothetical protein